MVRRDRGPVVLRGSLRTEEREFRARLAVAEEEGELARMRDVASNELARVQAQANNELTRMTREITQLKAEAAARETSLAQAREVLVDLRGSRGYRLMRRLGRWGSLDRGIRKALK